MTFTPDSAQADRIDADRATASASAPWADAWLTADDRKAHRKV